MASTPGTFENGIVINGTTCKEFTLAEECFGHLLGIQNDPAVDANRLGNDEAYYAACMYAQCLTVVGIEKITPGMIMDLSVEDGFRLLKVKQELKQRRGEFRGEAQAGPQDDGGAAQTGH